MFESIDPATGQIFATYAEHGAAEVENRLDLAASASRDWRRVPLQTRTNLLAEFGNALEARTDELAQLITREVGKTIRQSRAEVEKSAWACQHFADSAADYLAPQMIATDNTDSHVRFDPLGAVFAIMPWNYPFWQVLRFLAPITAAGNVVLLKHAGSSMGCGEAIADLAVEVGYPAGVIQTLRIDHDAAADVIADPRVHAVTFTGSTGGGRRVAALAGASGKKTVLELGGSDPFLVLEGADVEAAASKAVTSRLMNNGQSCVCAKRFIVSQPVADEFTDAVAAGLEAAIVGDPTDEATDVGPMARSDLRDVLTHQIDRSVAAGARLVIPGGTVDGPGFYFVPALLADVQPEHAVAVEETFGPVGAICVVPDHHAAVELANASEFGLGAAVWTRDHELALDVTAALDVGVVSINDLVKSDPRLPFGGMKSSGYGRELGPFGVYEFTNIKSVSIGE